MQAVRWAVEDINAKGGVMGRKLEAIILDHQAKPAVGIACREPLRPCRKGTGVHHRLQQRCEGSRAARQSQ